MVKRIKDESEIAHWEGPLVASLPDIDKLMEEYAENRESINLLEERQEELKPELEAAVIIGGNKTLQAGNFRTTQGSGRSAAKIIPERVVEKLAGLGQTADQIVEIMEYITQLGKPYTYPVVTRVPVEVAADAD